MNFGNQTDNEAIRELRDTMKNLNISTRKSSCVMTYLTVILVILTFILVIFTWKLL